ncbi:helix-turn-helix domain-containing protein [Romboutsia hominis]|uniref:helix-turn-helix domain-containing protein n=1 Tax=Romboutsia hominis TaxID=1507512 RepID=UPI001F067355|nr:helix-turn-helix transcriptional regulator [Romboutsia hominis]MCH1959495.1 helix-turn-helix transcriptional regulator [Romboutsia hominis]
MNYNYKYLKLMRKQKNYTASEISKLIGIDQSNYSKIENGKYQGLNFLQLSKLTETLDLDLYKLLLIERNI